MSDLVERLRANAVLTEHDHDKDVLREAADRIAQLEGELSDALTDLNTARQDNVSCTVHVHNQADRIAQLEAALRDIDGCSAQAHVRHIARAALGEDRT